MWILAPWPGVLAVKKMGTETPLAVVQIVGAPVACAEGVKDTWREVTAWAAGQLKARFGAAVQVDYFDLFDPGCPPLPDGAELPLVTVNGDVISAGGKISIPMIRERLEGLGVEIVGS